MIIFASSHVDLQDNIVFTSAQLTRRWDQELGKKWRSEVQDNLRDFMQMKPALDPETFPGYVGNDAMLTEFIADKQACYECMMQDMARNQLLIDTLAHEAALRRKAELQLIINGRDEVIEVPEQIDPETGEVTQEYVVPVPGQDPLAQTIEAEGKTVDNPAYLAAAAELSDVQSTIDSAVQDVLDLVAARVSPD